MPEHIGVLDEDINSFLLRYNATNLDRQKKPLEFDEVRREALTSWHDIQACPGSGKTTLIAAKLMILAKKWNVKNQGICVLTHTNVACDEIRSRLQADQYGYQLLSYPHFIGTIQEFANKFMALPSVRKSNLSIRFIDDDDGFNPVLNSGENLGSLYGSLYFKFGGQSGTSPYPIDQGIYKSVIECLKSLFWLNTKFDIAFYGPNGSLISLKNDPTKKTYPKLKSLKEAIQAQGYYQYKDMYVFASVLLEENSSLRKVLQNRFSVIFLDEMQDTQKFQDEMVNSIFLSDNTKIQRFGDPDQAIYDRIGNEDPNETFNQNTDLSILAHSHRFSTDIASKVSCLSYSQIGEITALDNTDPPSIHTIIIYDDNGRKKVLNEFAEIVAAQDTNENWKCLKAVGATEGKGGYISAYWGGFDRRKSTKSPRPERLIDVIARNWREHDRQTEHQYKLILKGVLDMLRIAKTMDTRVIPPKNFNMNSLKSWLVENNHYSHFRELVTDWILNDFPSVDRWTGHLETLKNIFKLADNNELSDYFAHSFPEYFEESDRTITNIFEADNGRKIEVGTIHSVKGETHDATLVMETKFNQHDIQQLLGKITGKDSGKIIGPRKIKFARQLYVAFSRPRHLLCLAIHKDHILAGQSDDLAAKGWVLKSI